MNKESGVGKALAITGGALATAGAGGAGGYFLGKRQGGEQVAGEMATRFMAANQKENKALARHYFRKGLTYNPSMKKESSMDKTATLQEVFDSAYHDELDKIAAVGGDKVKKVIDVIRSTGGKAINAYKESGKALYSKGKSAVTKGMESLKKNPSHPYNNRADLAAKQLRSEAAQEAGAAISGGRLALGTAGALGVGGTGGVMLAGGKKK